MSKEISTSDFISKSKYVHGDKYDYTKVEYKDVQTKIDIICPEHGVFRQTPRNHLTGSGCRKCANISIANSRRGSYEEFVRKAKEIHGDMYVYPHFVYRDAISAVPIICPKPGHGKFSQSPNSHLNGAGCPICSTSKMEIKTADFLNSHSLSFERQKKFIKGRRLSFDFWIPARNTLIECQGKQHYTFMRYFHRSPADFALQRDKDKLKRDFANKSGAKLIEIPYWEKDIKGFLARQLRLKKVNRRD